MSTELFMNCRLEYIETVATFIRLSYKDDYHNKIQFI